MVKLDIKKLRAINYPAAEFLLSEKGMTWDEAVDWVKSQGEDWRLPTLRELQAYAWQLKGYVQERYCWSGSLVSNAEGKVWAMDVCHGSSYSTLKDDPRPQAICLRRQ